MDFCLSPLNCVSTRKDNYFGLKLEPNAHRVVCTQEESHEGRRRTGKLTISLDEETRAIPQKPQQALS